MPSQFLSTLSLRRATSKLAKTSRTEKISIHALLAESDHQTNAGSNESSEFLSTLSLRRATIFGFGLIFFQVYFYPRSPCGERRISSIRIIGFSGFLSTLSLRRATWARGSRVTYVEFLSTLSLRRATVHYDNYNLHCVISIHALLAESDLNPSYAALDGASISIHALLAESDQRT